MTMTVPIYWFWDGNVSDENDSEFINKQLNASVTVNASIAKTLYETLMSFDKTVDTDVDFSVGAIDTNGQEWMLREGTQDDDYPIIYARGVEINNFLTYAGYCWSIVRTTETGGIKLVYAGSYKDGYCLGYFKDEEEIRSVFNEKSDSPVYVGYMYNDTNKFYSSNTLA